MSDINLSPLIVIVGPTSVGKTELALKLAQSLKGEIISADSRLFYRGMDIGTAKPSLGERNNVPHHLVDVADPDEVWTLAHFQQMAFSAIEQVHRRQRLPFLVGGTGQYIRAVIENWQIPRGAPNPGLRIALEDWAEAIGADGLHSRLATLDPTAAGKIDPRNVRRTIRALEVIFSTGVRFSDQRHRGQPLYRNLLIGLNRPRDELYQRIDDRIDNMIRDGLVDEVRGLLASGYSPDLPAMTAIGYREIINYLTGRITLDEAIMLIKRATRVFVRRQANWFRIDDPSISWFQVEPETINHILDWIHSEMAGYIQGMRSMGSDFQAGRRCPGSKR